ncbi:hypothetical protein DM860_009639 [Cuscuta australis]|uniref:FYVE-type domain-containing protein n=1 Tax=Cuscuta australis TaxID=267555 RepID=A0A328DJ02_9ASTE|nr:hypothetical protein DM860_009639 [Cuscuta australis]
MEVNPQRQLKSERESQCISLVYANRVQSWVGSPYQLFSEKGYSDGLSHSSDSFSEPSTSSMNNGMDSVNSNSPYVQPFYLNKRALDSGLAENQAGMLNLLETSLFEYAQPANNVPRDVFIWGEGIEGDFLGVGGRKLDALSPKFLDSNVMFDDVQMLSLRRSHAFFATKHGDVFSWGEGKHGRLGHKVDSDSPYPRVVESLEGIHVKSVSCSEYQTYALTATGELYKWGDDISSADSQSDNRKRSYWLPHKVSDGLDGIKISSVSCGEWHTAILSISGQLFTYGDGVFGALGHGNTKTLPHPKQVESLEGLRVKYVSCGSWHTAAIVEIIANNQFEPSKPVGKLFTWGHGDKGRLGHSDHEKKLVPACVAKLVEQDFYQVSCGADFTVVLSSTGKVYTMGCPQGKDDDDVPIKNVQGELKDEFVREISAGCYHVAVLTSKGNVYSWGRGMNGQLGTGDRKDRSSPTLVDALENRHVEHIFCGPNSTAALCLPKSMSTNNDQSTCKGCNLAFGITRKKHNCYNCGVLLCRACGRKTSANGSLPGNKTKPLRVCDPCFNQLRRTAQLGTTFLEHDIYSPRPHSMISHMEENDERDQVSSTTCRMTPRRKFFSMSGSQMTEKKARNHQDEKNQNLISSWLDFARWGQVPCPQRFKRYLTEHETVDTTAKERVGSAMTPPDCSKLDYLRLEEIQKLRNQVESLKKKCRLRNKKIQECQQKLEEVWLVAKAEAARREAAQEVIKALTSKLHATSKNQSVGRETNEKDSAHSIADDPCNLPKTLRINARKADSLCTSPIIFSRSLCNKDDTRQSLSGDESCQTESEMGQGGHEWVERYKPGIYITLKSLQNGERMIKQLRFR